MKKILLATAFLVVVVLVAGALLVLNHPKETSPTVEIEAFNWTSNWEIPGGLQMIKQFNLTLHNLTDKDCNATVNVKLVDANGSQLQSATGFFGSGTIGDGAELTSSDSLLHGGEVRGFRGVVMTNVGETGNANGEVSVVVEVNIDGLIVDELEIPKIDLAIG